MLEEGGVNATLRAHFGKRLLQLLLLAVRVLSDFLPRLQRVRLFLQHHLRPLVFSLNLLEDLCSLILLNLVDTFNSLLAVFSLKVFQLLPQLQIITLLADRLLHLSLGALDPMHDVALSLFAHLLHLRSNLLSVGIFL